MALPGSALGKFSCFAVVALQPIIYYGNLLSTHNEQGCPSNLQGLGRALHIGLTHLTKPLRHHHFNALLSYKPTLRGSAIIKFGVYLIRSNVFLDLIDVGVLRLDVQFFFSCGNMPLIKIKIKHKTHGSDIYIQLAQRKHCIQETKNKLSFCSKYPDLV